MRMHLLIASVAILALAVAPAMALPPINADGDLSDWGVTPGTDWTADPSNVIAAWTTGDDVVTALNSGGEFFDIEAVYLRLDVDMSGNQWLSWAMVTSYAGNEVSDSYTAIRNGPFTGAANTGSAAYPYRRNPVVALDFNQGSNVPYWRWGLMLAPAYDWTWDGSGNAATDFSFAGSTGLYDPDIGAWDQTASTWDNTRTLGSFSTTPQLWSVEANGWRSGRPTYGFPDDPRRRPIDFDTRTGWSGNDNAVLATNGSSVAIRDDSYIEGAYYSDLVLPGIDTTGQVPGQSSWPQRNNWVWEGYIAFPDADNNGIDFASITDVDFHYGMWCANNHTMGDAVDYGVPPPTPELGTWALLLATGAIGGWARRRRTN